MTRRPGTLLHIENVGTLTTFVEGEPADADADASSRHATAEEGS